MINVGGAPKFCLSYKLVHVYGVSFVKNPITNEPNAQPKAVICISKVIGVVPKITQKCGYPVIAT